VTQRRERNALPVLITGFALVFLLLLFSGVAAIDSMRSIESEAARSAAQQQATVRLIYEVQSEEGNLSSVFYSLAAGEEYVDGEPLLKRLDALEAAIRRTTDIGAASQDAALWMEVRRAADSFIAEGRDTIRNHRRPSHDFYVRHQNLLAALADLTGSSVTSNGAVPSARERQSTGIRYSLGLLGAALLLAMTGALLTVYIVNRMFRRLRWQAEELAELSSRTMSDHEEMARRLSREMHDEFGQILSAIEANLVSMQNARAFHPGRIDDCLGLVKDGVANVREVCQLLRPSILDDFGLNAGVRWLAENFAERTGKQVRFKGSFDARLDGTIETQIFRIAQEALTNVGRHSGATRVDIELFADAGLLSLRVTDNGRGIESGRSAKGNGMVGMRARARTIGATLALRSRPGEGVSISLQIPYGTSAYASQNPHFAGR
jgi:signal transduction histidine kinase